MGAFGAALIAMEQAGESSSIMTLDELNNFSCTTNLTRCKLCNNHCLLTIHKFKNGENFISGNRCDNPLGKMKKNTAPNMFDYKYNRLFNYTPLEPSKATRGEIGIPRVLNLKKKRMKNLLINLIVLLLCLIQKLLITIWIF